MDILFGSVFATTAGTVDPAAYMMCTLASLILGVLAAFFYSFRHKASKSLLFTVALLPSLVQLVIMLVNGNVGAGIAVMGAFSLVRFRSIPGNARDIAAIFLAMAIGLAMGMGFIGIAAIFAVVMGLAMIFFTYLPLMKEDTESREMKIIVPENVDYETAFDEVFETYTDEYELVMVKMIDMGSLYQLRYTLNLKKEVSSKDFIDDLRCRNGNLDITYGKKIFSRETI